MGGSSFRMPLRKFLSSDRLSDVALRFDEHSEGGGAPSRPSYARSDEQATPSGKDSLRPLNATRIALMLAKAFAKTTERRSKEEAKTGFDAASLRLDNFVVRLHLGREVTAGTGGGHMAEAGRRQEVRDDLGDYVELLTVMADRSRQDLNDGGSDSLSSSADAVTSETWFAGSFSNTATCIVLGVDAIDTSNSASNQIPPDSIPPGKNARPMQMLGEHIRAIYSQGGRLSPAPVDRAARSEGLGSPGRRSSKSRMLEGNCLFSTLLEGGEYPLSVCRLLSDMIDGKSDSPFASIDDVIQDLEQMVNHPQIFLYDQDFNSSNLLFGQGCYGRVKELTSLLEISTELEHSKSPSSLHGSKAVYVRGVAGSGKSHFVQNVGSFLSNLGWAVLKVKFKRDSEHRSREILSSLFDNMISNLVLMKEGDDEEDKDYARRAAEAIRAALDSSSLSSLAIFTPSIGELIPDTDKNASLLAEAELSHWQLVFLFSKLAEAILSLGRHIMICLDDLQWCDSTTIGLISELLTYVGQQPRSRQHFLFVGLYRDDEIIESHPLAYQLAILQKSSDVEVAEIKLSSLSRDEVADMIMSEMRLPRRLVHGLAGVVHKKTSGHALSVCQLLNLLVRDSTIAYSPRKHRFDWDENKIASLKTMDSVASLIVSNLSSLEAEALQSLRILSCFGVQTPLSLLNFFAGCACVPKKGIKSYLPGLVEGGVVEISGPSIFFSHDLIQQHVYNNIPLVERQHFHLEIGSFIASKIALDNSLVEKSVEASIEHLKIIESDSGQKPTSPSYALVAIATNQINFSGPESVSDRSQRMRFARWNLCAGKDAAERSNFQSALYYYKSGIAFLGDRLWAEDAHQLSHQLVEGSVSALFANGDYLLAAKQANEVIDRVLFEDSLVVQYILFRSLTCLGRYAGSVSTGLEVLRKLKFDIPEPSSSSLAAAMSETGKAASAYTFIQITNTRHIVDPKKRNVFKIVESLIPSFFRTASPFLPLVGCATVNYSLKNGVCVESCAAFMLFGYFKVSLEDKYEEGRYWGQVCLKILDSSPPTLAVVRIDTMSTTFLNFWYYPFKDSAFRLLKNYQRFVALGDIESALLALSFSLMLSFYGGEKLSLVLNSMEELIRSMMKHDKEGAKLTLSIKLLIDELIGNSGATFPDFGGGIINNETSLLADAQSKNNFHLVEGIYTRRFNSAFWMGDYAEARKYSRAILALPSSKNSKPQLAFHTYFMGLISFQLYQDGEGEEWLDKGKKVISKMAVWAKNSTTNFENKLLLLEAEHHASMCNIYAAKSAFEASVRSARDHGLVHEQALASELHAKFLSSIVEIEEAICWFKCAHACYRQWGAIAKAEQVWKDHNLGLAAVGSCVDKFANAKHGREW